jgi:hypothetical protein
LVAENSEGGSPVSGRSAACVPLCSQPCHRKRRLHPDRKGGICRADARGRSAARAASAGSHTAERQKAASALRHLGSTATWALRPSVLRSPARGGPPKALDVLRSLQDARETPHALARCLRWGNEGSSRGNEGSSQGDDVYPAGNVVGAGANDVAVEGSADHRPRRGGNRPRRRVVA